MQNNNLVIDYLIFYFYTRCHLCSCAHIRTTMDPDDFRQHVIQVSAIAGIIIILSVAECIRLYAEENFVDATAGSPSSSYDSNSTSYDSESTSYDSDSEPAMDTDMTLEGGRVSDGEQGCITQVMYILQTTTSTY